MSASTGRVGAAIRKELAEFRRNRLIVTTAAVLPVVFLVGPTISILNVKASALNTTLGNRVGYSLFIPLLAAWRIWVGLAILTRVSDTRVSQQLSVLDSLPPVALAALMQFQVISPTFVLAAALVGGLRGPQPFMQLPMAEQHQFGENVLLGRVVVRVQGRRVNPRLAGYLPHRGAMEAVLGIQGKRGVQDFAPGPWRCHAVWKLHGDSGQPPRLPSGGRVPPLRHHPVSHRHTAPPLITGIWPDLVTVMRFPIFKRTFG